MEIGNILSMLGSPGKYATIVFILCYIAFYYVVFCDLFPSVYGAVPPHRCALPAGADLNMSVPRDEDGSFSSCSVYVNYTHPSNQTTSCKMGWIYDASPGEATISTEWNLVCGKKYLNSLSISLYYVGVVCGALIFGTLSDTWGRRPVLLCSLVLSIFVGILIYFVESYVVFTALKFVTGVAKQGMHINLYIIGLEYFASPSHRAIAVAMIDTTWSMGGIALAGMSYLLKNWRIIQLIILTPCLVSLLYIWFIPESLRWQLSKRKFVSAATRIRLIGNINGLNVENKYTTESGLQETLADPQQDSEEKTVAYTSLDLFRHVRVRRRTLLILYVWFANSFLYYGLLLNSFRLPGNRFVNIGISMAVELPSYLLFPFLVKRTNRKVTLVAFCLMSGTFCTAATFTPTSISGKDLGWLYIALYNASKVCTTITWAVLALMTFELYPTLLRASGFGSCHLSAKVGSIVAPQILNLVQSKVEWLALILPGVSVFLAALAAALLPDTKSTKLPETLQEMEQIEGPIDRLLSRIWSPIPTGGHQSDTAQNNGMNLQNTRKAENNSEILNESLSDGESDFMVVPENGKTDDKQTKAYIRG